MRASFLPEIYLSIYLSISLSRTRRHHDAETQCEKMLVSILARPAAHRSAFARMQAAPDDLNRAFASYAGEARRGGVLWEGPEPDVAFAPDEVCVCGAKE